MTTIIWNQKEFEVMEVNGTLGSINDFTVNGLKTNRRFIVDETMVSFQYLKKISHPSAALPKVNLNVNKGKKSKFKGEKDAGTSHMSNEDRQECL